MSNKNKKTVTKEVKPQKEVKNQVETTDVGAGKINEETAEKTADEEEAVKQDTAFDGAISTETKEKSSDIVEEGNLKGEDLGKDEDLVNIDNNTTRSNVKDVVIWGSDKLKLIQKASSQAEGWMKSTKAMKVQGGVVLQVTTQQRNPDGSYAIAEAVTFIPGASIHERRDKDGKVIDRSLL